MVHGSGFRVANFRVFVFECWVMSFQFRVLDLGILISALECKADRLGV
jgi:hypothetical protein